jgi:DNA-binding NtrC family response regulator
MSSKARILVVDDERSMQEFLEIFFRSEGYEVVTAGDVQSARLHLEGDEFPGSICCTPLTRSRPRPWSS